jgi:hypothetical protein
MKSFPKLFRPLRRLVWVVLVAFMVGVHNFYKQEMDSPDSIVNSIQLDEGEEDSSPKDGIKKDLKISYFSLQLSEFIFFLQ